MSLSESKLAYYKEEAAKALNEYPFVSDAYVMNDGRLIAELDEGWDGSVYASLPEYLSVEKSGTGILQLSINERWAPMHLD